MQLVDQFSMQINTAAPQGLEKIVVVNPNHEDCSQIQPIDSTSELYNKRTFSGV